MDLIRGQCLSRLALSYDINVYGLSNFVFLFPRQILSTGDVISYMNDFTVVDNFIFMFFFDESSRRFFLKFIGDVRKERFASVDQHTLSFSDYFKYSYFFFTYACI